MDFLQIVVVSFAFLFGAGYLYVKHKFSFWLKLGVNGPTPKLINFGNAFQIAGGIPTVIELELQQKFGKVYGSYAGFEPVLSVSDPEFIKQILVKDFQSWINRRKLNVYHEFNNNNQFNAEGVQWKRLRSVTGKAFSTGRLRGLQSNMERCVDKFSDFLTKLTANGSVVLNVKEAAAGFTIDVIATSFYATETNSNEGAGSQNPFVANALRLFDIHPLKMMSFFAMPRWFNDLIQVKMNLNEKAIDFFVEVSKELVKQRKSSSVKRNDFVQMVLDNEISNTSSSQSKPDTLKLSEKEIIGQNVLFFMAGFEPGSAAIGNTIYELALNPQVQDRLREEILSAKLEELNPEEYLETVMSHMPYLDAVVKESLRKYPHLVRLERRLAVDEYNLAGIPMKKDQLVEISTIAVHYNSEFFPDPFAFNPDRFMPENKSKLVPYTFFPFGDGPRNCVGMRFAYQEIKLFMAKILPRFRFSAAPNTPKEPQFGTFKALLFVKPFQVLVEKVEA